MLYYNEVWEKEETIENMKKIGKVIGCFLPTIAAFATQVLAASVISTIYVVILTFWGVNQGITDDTELYDAMMQKLAEGNFLLIVTAIATFYTLIIGFFWYRGLRPKTDFKLKEVINAKLLAAMFLLGVSLQLLISMCLNAVFPLLPNATTTEYSELIESLIGGNIWLSLLVTVVLAPLAEELLFRGVTLKKAQKFMPFMAANLLQALLFGIYHGNLIQGTYAFVLGLILGFTAEYFHSIWASVLLHAFVNGSAELLGLLPESMTSTLAGVIALSVVGVILLFVAAKLYPGARRVPETVCPEPKETDAEFTENSFDE
ncbi:MAG: CPBP family intramembrane metalloprotease [Lachnospiraceae bacterium]|nr:CPBP family intramembrane metalloprotease [Lachnospiraceae bacterium]